MIADSFDAMTHEQPWRAALPHDHACEEIGRVGGTHLDPELTSVFIDELSP
jgi:HD-GYP domain-containing protein (c-di-GMP phosphodiesterase class II)